MSDETAVVEKWSEIKRIRSAERLEMKVRDMDRTVWSGA